MKTIRAAAGVLFAVVAAAGWTPRVLEAADPVTFTKAAADVKTLGEQIRDRKRGNADLIGSIEAIEAQFFLVEMPADPRAVGPVQMREWQEKALDQLFAALRAVEVKTGRVNLRDEVNLRAAKALEKVLTSPDLVRFRDERAVAALRADRARQLMTVVDADFGRTGTKDHDVPPAVLEAAFAAIARIDKARAFDWLAEEYVHTRGGPFEEPRLIAAQKSMVLLANLPGKKRHAIAEVMTRIYSGTDASAKQPTADGRANKAFWDRVRVTTIAAINHFATAPGGGPPTDAAGLGLTTMDELAEWWRKHKSPTQAPWLDPKPPK